MKVFLSSLLLVLPFTFAQAASGAPPGKKPFSFEDARRVGWEFAAFLLEDLGKGDPEAWPGTHAWLDDFRRQTRGISEKTPVEKWPQVGTDALLDRNPNFWRMWYEIAPGDPALTSIYAALLLSQGEAMRAAYVVELGRHRPGIPKEIQESLQFLQTSAIAGMEPSRARTAEGIALFDRGDYDGAMQKYREALRLCPQNGWTYYEMAYTLRTQARIARGEKLLKPGEVVINGKWGDSPEVTSLLAKSRRHCPLQYMAYQGSDQEAVRGLVPLVKKVMPAWEALRKEGIKRHAEYAALKDLSEGFQEAGVHDLALLARQLMVAHRVRYDPVDHPLIAASLRKLAPGEKIESILTRLAGKERLKLRQLVALDDVDGQSPWGETFHNPIDGTTLAPPGGWRGYMPRTSRSKSEKDKPVYLDHIRLLTAEGDLAKRTTVEALVRLSKSVESLADQILSKSEKDCKITVQFTCTPSGQEVKMANQPQEVDQKVLQQFQAALWKIDKLLVREGTVELQFVFSVTAKKRKEPP